MYIYIYIYIHIYTYIPGSANAEASPARAATKRVAAVPPRNYSESILNFSNVQIYI